MIRYELNRERIGVYVMIGLGLIGLLALLGLLAALGLPGESAGAAADRPVAPVEVDRSSAAADIRLNPELKAFRYYAAARGAAVERQTLAVHPELKTFRNYAAAEGAAVEREFLTRNPEVGAFWRYQQQMNGRQARTGRPGAAEQAGLGGQEHRQGFAGGGVSGPLFIAGPSAF
jgi:hypothetical protein